MSVPVRLSARRVLPLTLAAALALAPSRALALHRELPFLLGVTPVPGTNVNPGPSRGEPGWIAFESTSDVMRNGSFGREVYLYASKNDVIDRSPAIGQITNFLFDSGNPTTSGQGGEVALDSAADILGNGNANRQIFLWTRTSGEFVQLTSGAGTSSRPHIDLKGEVIAFQSTADLLRNGSSGAQIFVYNTAARPPINPLTQVTFPPGESFNPQISHEGEVVTFESAAPLLGPASGFTQLYAYHRTTRQLVQLTNGSGDSINASPDGIGRFVAFQSRANLLNAGAPGWQIYLLDRQLGVLRQITTGPGESFTPSLSRGDQFVSFVSTGDLLGIGTTGQHVYVYDPRLALLFQVTTQPGSMGEKPVSSGANFVTFVSDEDLLQTGVSGKQVYLLNTFERIPNAFIGERQLRFVPGDGTLGSGVRVAARDWVGTAGLPPNGQIFMLVGQRDAYAEATVTVRPNEVRLPPVPVAGFGTICLAPTGNAQGVYDCDGNRSGGDLVITQDHNIVDVDPGCVEGCVEGQPCQGVLPGPHVAACNGNAQVQRINTYTPGGLQLRMPVRLSVARTPGLDGVSCNADDGYVFQNLDMILEFTTGSATATVLDADAIPGANLTLTQTGAPFECRRMEQANLAGGQLVATFPLLDLPNAPPGLRDVVVGLRLEPFEGRPYLPCTGLYCQVLTFCASDADCNDGDICNGVETCSASGCVPGPLVCDDGNVCNGVETCDPVLGCQLGVPPNCVDGALCTADSCDPVAGCSNPSITGCCTGDPDCADLTVCNGAEACVAGDCVPGAALVCDDADACTGLETCDPALGCQPGQPLACDDGALCTADGCDATLGCINAPLSGCCTTDADCRNNNACDGDETCVAGDCVAGTPPDCNDGAVCTADVCEPLLGCTNTPIPACCASDADCINFDACDGLEICNAGTCAPGTPPTCDDGATCTADSCVSPGGCVNTSISGCCAVDADCINNNQCDGTESCLAGDCLPGTPLTCDDSDFCNGLETCDPALGCQSGTPLNCSDGAVCTADICDLVQGCINPSISGCCLADADCIDNDFCDGTESCVAGDCVAGTPLTCDDGNFCNGFETCDPATGCASGLPPTCDDLLVCTADSCDPLLGCLHSGVVGCCSSNTDCDDGNLCTGAEFCDLTSTCVAGPGPGAATILGIRCQVATLRSSIAAAAPVSVGGARIHARLMAFLGKIDRALSDVSRRGRPKPVNGLVASRFLKRITSVLDRAIDDGVADYQVAAPLADLARNIRSNVEHYRVGAPQPS